MIIIRSFATLLIIVAFLNLWNAGKQWQKLTKHRNGITQNIEDARSRYGENVKIDIDDGGAEVSIKAHRDGSLIRAFGGFFIAYLLFRLPQQT